MAERRGDLLSLLVGVLGLLGAFLGLLTQADAVQLDGAVLLAGVVLAGGGRRPRPVADGLRR